MRVKTKGGNLILNPTVLSCIRASIDKMEGYSHLSVRSYEYHLRSIFSIIGESHPDVAPATVTVEIIKETVESLKKKNYAVSTQKIYLFALRRICEENGNDVFRSVKLIYQSDIRPRVDWITLQQAKKLLNLPKTPLQDIIISLELLHGLRRIEIMRLKLTDIHEDYLEVTGKGRGGGKLRSIPMHPSFPRTLSRWMAHRRQLCSQSSDAEPEELIIYRKGSHLYRYHSDKSTAIDTHVKSLSDALGVHFSNHTLRRTFGREMWHSGVSVETIARMLGHESTEMTLRYIGINLDDMQSAMKQFRL